MKIPTLARMMGMIHGLLSGPLHSGTEVRRESFSAPVKVRVELLAKNKSRWKFRLTNVSGEVVKLTSMFPSDTPEPFAPAEVRYEYLSRGVWKERHFSDDTIPYRYLVQPGQQKVFWIVIAETFDDVPKGSLVRIRINGFISEPMRWP